VPRGQTLVDPPDAWIGEAVGGRPQVVKAGVPLATDPADVACDVRNPRTSAGLSRDRRTLYLAVVDGRTKISARAGDVYAASTTTDIDGDGRSDVCGRANAKIVCTRFDGVGFGPTFNGPSLADADGWDVHERYATLRFADVDGDRRADLCVRGPEGVQCHISDGVGFGAGGCDCTHGRPGALLLLGLLAIPRRRRR